ncbi:MAG: hypothetical protein OXQ29_05020 [Rhodospirillaceae bacterium]|nr:hypothetical protein [Rhodospirillaceae bacterium]
MRFAAVVAVVAILPLHVAAQTPTRGRVDRTIDVRDFDDFEFYLPDEADTITIYAQWSNSSVVRAEDITLLCLRGEGGVIGGEDDDISLRNSRHAAYDISPGKLWYTTTVRGERCWITLDFQHRERYDRSARARFIIILSERDATEETWRGASASEMGQVNVKRQMARRR